MARYDVHEEGVDKARELIDANQYVLDSSWSAAQPDPDDENDDIDRHDHEQFGLWHLAVDPSASAETKARYAFPYGDFRRVHRSALIAAKSRAAQNGHDAIADAADELRTALDDLARS